MRILMVGAGATGGFYGGLLARAGRAVTFLLRPGRTQQMREQGLRVVLHTGEEVVLQPPVLTAGDLRAHPLPFDLVIVSTKAYQLAQAMEDIAPAVGPTTMIMPILNGMRQFDLLQARFPGAHVLGGSVRIMSFLDERGRIVQMNELDQFNYGELSGERTARILAVDAVLTGAGFTATLQPDIVATLWHKWAVLASLGAPCVLARGDSAEIASAPYGVEMTRALIAECNAVAASKGYPLPPELLAQHVARMTDTSTGIGSSLYRDMLAGAPVEADHILGDLIARAGEVRVPLLQAAYVRLKVYEAQQARAAVRVG